MVTPGNGDETSIGPVRFNSLSLMLSCGDRSYRLPPRTKPVLLLLAKKPGFPVRKRALEQVRTGTTPLKQLIYEIENGFRKLNLDGAVTVDCTVKESYCLRIAQESEEAVEIVENPGIQAIAPTPETSDSPSGFTLSVDGIILNSAAELIFGTVSEEAVRKCRLLYKSAIEDFAFAVVYGSHLRSKWLPKSELPSSLLSRLDSGKRLVKESAEGIIARLPGYLYSADPFDDKYRYGKVLESESGRNQIGQYIQSFAEAMTIPGYEPQALCRQWLVREAEIYLGDDPRLFEESDNPQDFHFRKQYYESDLLIEVPKLLGNDVLETLIGFLRSATKVPCSGGNVSPYSSSALRHFVLSNVLTHVTTMYEYEQSTQSATARKLPFALRGAIKKQWNAEHRDQSVLRKLLVRSALNEALRQSADANSREDLIRRLLWLRDQQPFLRVRSRLEAFDLLTMSPSESSERNAAILYAEISKDGGGEHAQSEHVEIDQSMVIRGSVGKRLPDPGADEYLKRLHEFFPELAPVPDGLKTSRDRPVQFGQRRSHWKNNLARFGVKAA
jgi:hypothetical protein